MTDRYDALFVVLDVDLRSDDAEALISAIKQFRHVISVEGHISDFDGQMALMRTKTELKQALWQVLA